MDSTLKIYYQNVRGLRTKTNAFYKNLLQVDYDVICLSETWLHENIFSAELFDSRYSVYRCDRNYSECGNVLGGGVLIAIKSNILIRSSSTYIDTYAAEIIKVSIFSNTAPCTRMLHILCCYFPQGSMHYDTLCDFFDRISEEILRNSNDNYLIVGDFNIPSAQWTDMDGNSHLSMVGVGDKFAYSLSNFLNFSNLKQFNKIRNINGRLLDLIFTDMDCCVCSCTFPLVGEDNHHPALHVNLRKCIFKELQPSCRTIRLFHAADYERINEALATVDWHDILSDCDAATAVDTFYQTINKIVSDLVPIRIKYGNGFPCWYSKSLIKIIREKLKYHRKWKKYNRLSDYNQFSILRERQKSIQLKCYENYICLSELKIKKNSKYFWSFIKSKKSSNSIPNHLTFNEKSVTEGNEMCILFNEYFKSVYDSAELATDSPINNDSSKPTLKSTPTLPNHISIGTISLSTQIIEKYLNKLDTNKGQGPDGLPPLFLKMCSKQLSYPLFLLFSKSLNQGEMPKVWKKSLVTPIFKSGDRYNVKDYRPISKLSTIAKLFEKIIVDNIFPVLRTILAPQQHGFVSRKSTDTNLCEFVQHVSIAMDQGYQVDAVYTDYSKAFDKISHNLLIIKLEEVGIHGDLLRWISSYLRDRSQAVAIRGFCSTFVPVTSGVPQGSHLGPLLFNVFVNDIRYIFKHSSILLYADDMKIYKNINNSNDCMLLQNDLDELSKYCDDNHLLLNIKKCKIISYSRKKTPVVFNYKLNGKVLSRVSEVRDLGVHLDSKLTFKPHVDIIVARAFRTLGFVLRASRDFKNADTLITLYKSLVRPILEYGSIIWNPQYKIYINEIERIQRKFKRSLTARFPNIDACLVSLEQRRMEKDQMFLYKLLNNMIDSPILLNSLNFRCPSKSSRCKSTFNIPLTRTKYAKNNFIYRSCARYNKVYAEIDYFSVPLGLVKKRIKALSNC